MWAPRCHTISTPSGAEKGTMNEIETHETTIATTTTDAVIAAEAPTPVTAAEELIQPRGSFASGEETTPEKDAEERAHPGSFGDTEPTA